MLAAIGSASRALHIAGLCSGGDIAFQLGLKDPRVAGVVMMNPRTFCVHDLALVEAYKGARYYQESFFRKEQVAQAAAAARSTSRASLG